MLKQGRCQLLLQLCSTDTFPQTCKMYSDFFSLTVTVKLQFLVTLPIWGKQFSLKELVSIIHPGADERVERGAE